MRIVFTRFPFSSALGGLETVTLRMARGLRERGYDVSFIGTCPVLSRLFEEAGFSTTYLWLPRAPVSKQSLLVFLAMWPWLFFQKRRFLRLFTKGDAVYMLSLSEKILLTKSLKRDGVRVVWGEHEALMEDDGHWRNWLAKNPLLGFYRRMSSYARVVAVSDRLGQQFEQLGNIRNLIVIPNGVDTEVFRPMSSSDSLFRALTDLRKKHPDIFLIGTVARLKPEKGVREFLSVAERLSLKMPACHFILAGDGELRSELQEAVRAKNMAERVTLLGEIPATGIPSLYASLDLCLFLSTTKETFGLTAVEAMAMQRPTLISKHFGFLSPDLFHEEYILDPHDIDGVVATVLWLVQSPESLQLLARKQRDLVLHRFSIQSMLNAYERLFTSQ